MKIISNKEYTKLTTEHKHMSKRVRELMTINDNLIDFKSQSNKISDLYNALARNINTIHMTYFKDYNLDWRKSRSISELQIKLTDIDSALSTLERVHNKLTEYERIEKEK